MSDKGTGLTGMEIETEPEGCQQGKQLAHNKVHLEKREGEVEKGERGGGGKRRERGRWRKEREGWKERERCTNCYCGWHVLFFRTIM